MAHIKARQCSAAEEHGFHIRHLGRVQITDACDGREACHIVEPTTGGCGARIGERRIKHNLGDRSVGADAAPARSACARVQIIGRALAAAALGVVVERQRPVILGEAGVGFGTRCGEVPRVTGAAVDVGIGLVNMVDIIGRALAARDVFTLIKHLVGYGDSRCCPTAANEDVTSATAPKHLFHTPHLGSVETAQVQGSQLVAIIEHATHIDHIGGFEIAHVKAGQITTIIEHVAH